jgi:hypothetical protein
MIGFQAEVVDRDAVSRELLGDLRRAWTGLVEARDRDWLGEVPG